MNMTLRYAAGALLVLLLCNPAAAQVAPPLAAIKVDIGAQRLDRALNAWAKQTGLSIMIPTEHTAKDRIAPKVSGTYTPEEALRLLLVDTDLRYEFVDAKTVAIRVPKGGVQKSDNSTRVAGVRLVRSEIQSMQEVDPSPFEREGAGEDGEKSSSSSEDGDDQSEKGVPEILVKGKRSLNTDIQRTEDAPQPYVVFDKEEIQRSQAINLEDFLRTRLPMNTASSSFTQSPGDAVTLSAINLRGLGENQTLILVDGRRLPGVAITSSTPLQSDVNGIPLAAIERIEVLPSTAGGIYGGSATGGVINIVLRRDFRGLDIKGTFANTIDSDAANTRLDANAGFSLHDGRTQVMIAATYSEANSLLIRDRDFAAQAIALYQKNNPTNVSTLTTPPLGGTVNVRGIGGAFLQLKPEYGGAELGAAFTHIPLGYAGPASDNGAVLVANAGQYNLDLPGGVNGLERGLMAAPAMESFSFNLRRELGEHLEAFLDLSMMGNRGTSYFANVPNAVTLPANAPNNPFQQSVSVRFPTPGLSFESRTDSTTLRGMGGVVVELPREWMGEVSYSWNRSRFYMVSTNSVLDSVGTCVLSRGVPANIALGAPGPTTPCAIGDSRPGLNVLQEGNTFPIDFSPYLLPSPNSFGGPYDTILKNTALRLSGPAVSLPGGALRLSALIEHRKELIDDSFVEMILPATRMSSYTFYPHKSQDVNSYYLEARIPVITSRNSNAFFHELEIQATARRDEYTTMSDPNTAFSVPSRDGPLPGLIYATARTESNDYTLALRYAPSGDLAFRASFGTGFLPPSPTQISPRPGTVAGNLGADPKRGDTPMYVGVPFTRILGGSSNLKPERSESSSIGLILTPRILPELRLSVDYTKIRKVDEIQAPAVQFLLDNEDSYVGRVVRGTNLDGDPPGWAGPIVSLDQTLINIATTSLDAYDFQIDYTLSTVQHGEFKMYSVATRQSTYRNRLLPGAPAVERVGFNGGPLEWRGNLGIDWRNGPITVNWNAQYYDSYFIYTALALPLTPGQLLARMNSVRNQGAAKIPSQKYHDVVLTYHVDGASDIFGRLLGKSELSFGIQNLFNKAPPIIASTAPTSAGYSTYGDPRLRRYSISLRKSFH